jgi:membrane protease YdiL (CAAX protease family)
MTNIVVNRAERRLRSLWRLLLLPAAIGALAFGPVVGVIAFLEERHRAGEFIPGDKAFDKAMDFISGPLLTILIIVAIALLGRFIDRRRWRDFGLFFSRVWFSDFVFGLILGAGLIALVFAAGYAAGWMTLTERITPGVAGVPLWILWAFIVAKALCVAPAEELVSRGYLLKNAAEGLNGIFSAKGATLAAALLTSLVFAGLHMGTDNFNTVSLLGLTINGVLLVAPVLLTGRLAISIGLHMAWNLTQGGVFGFAVSGDIENISLFTANVTGPAEWTGGAYGPEGGYLGWLAMLVGIVAIVIRQHLRTRSARILPEIAEYHPR